jgi:two-component system NtrC family sensor kinase
MRDSFQGLISRTKDIRVPITTKLVLGFLIIVAFISTIYMVVGVQLINNRIVSEAQDKVRHDLNAARELYLGDLERISTAVRITADRFFLQEALQSGNLEEAYDELWKVRKSEGMDVLTLTDNKGEVILRTRFVDNIGDDLSSDELIKAVLEKEVPITSTIIVSGADLERESPMLAQNARFTFIDTPLAREREETEETDGMMLKSAYPVFDKHDNLLGILYGGTLINRNFEIVDKVKETVYEEVQYKGFY